MKNKYVTKCLCITLMSAMILTGSPAAVMASDILASENVSASEDLSSQPVQPSESPQLETPETEVPEVSPMPEDPTPTPGEPTPEITPAPTPGEPTPEITPAPTPGEPAPEVSPTPTPGEPTPEVSPTPTPGEPTPEVSPIPTPGEPTPEVSPTPTPEELTPVLTEKAQKVITMIEKMSGVKLTLKDEEKVRSIRKAYDELSEVEKLAVSNYNDLVEMEKTISALLVGDIVGDGTGKDDLTDGKGDSLTDKPSVQVGQPVYYTNMVSNLHAGKEFYLDSLKENYNLSFSEDFAGVMEEIEREYKEKNKLADVSEMRNLKTTTSEDRLLVRNWQDILSVYIYEQSKKGADTYVLDASCKEELARIFGEMNPVVRDKKDITKVSYGDYHINNYIKKNKIPKEDRAVLKKYMETDCKLLCAVVTGAKGFVRQSVGDDVSEERVNVISAAYSLVGEVGYFWGGKSTTLGMDPNWGQAAAVTAEGSRSSGTVRAYGLDCSGFVTWSVINGYQNQGMQAAVGDGTSDQWTKANVVSEADAQPGDLVFQRGPEAGSDNHVGILCGKTDAGDWIAVHCSSSKNGVTVGEAYSASFRYIRQPSFYPTEEELVAMEESRDALGAGEDMTLSSELYNAVVSDDVLFDAEEPKTLIDNSVVEPFVFAE